MILRIYCMLHCYNIMNCNDVCSRELNWVKLIGKFNE
jgi:succinate dehydrogenase/fumarate reductase-like Fe-S protein